jgi:alpha-ketoglutarate-dependent taurine dioxygenase
VDDLTIPVGGLATVDKREKAAITASMQRANMAIYSCRDATADRAAIRTFAAQFGLLRLDHHLCANDDGVAEVTVAAGGRRGAYVPYSSRSLSWHTDGYYNTASKLVRAVVLHCVQDAASGGQNAVLDPEIAYIRMRDANPAFISAFEHPECMTIPANVVDGDEIRPAVSGPVFSYDGPNGEMHMRYSARRKNIEWRDDPLITAAREFLSDFLSDEKSLVLRFNLRPGQGLISNNVLHDRTAFEDTSAEKRLLYRARYFDRIETS